MNKKRSGKTRKSERKNVGRGIMHIQSTFNNTIVTATDMNGNTICWSSAGLLGHRGYRKSTPFAAQQTAQDCANKAVEHGMQEVEVRVNGPGPGRESALRALSGVGLNVISIKDVTSIPHNGCRPPKRRRI